jgi:peptidoglycan hydrolase-like protein with peptidoglycan-binding domain
MTINIDSDWLDLGHGSTAPPERDHCGGVRISFRTYPKLTASSTGSRVTALQCLLSSRGDYSGPLDGTMNAATQSALIAYKHDIGQSSQPTAGEHVWTSLNSQGQTRLIKYGAASHVVRRLQRALNSAANERLPITGVFASQTTSAVKRYQSRTGLPTTGVVTDAMWTKLRKGITN